MIFVRRGAVEPAVLPGIRAQKLQHLRALGREPSTDDIDGYRHREVVDALWKAQHCKCCYCERKILDDYNDVEHYRPKARADRRPGCVERHGYWWLAYTWSNLMFACPTCNRSEKNDQFPLGGDSVPLVDPQQPPGAERPLLLDPSGTINPVCHIQFSFQPLKPFGPDEWVAIPREKSELGKHTIAVCGLNRPGHLELRKRHVLRIHELFVTPLQSALASANSRRIGEAYERALALLMPSGDFVALTYDALLHFVPPHVLQRVALRWPEPDAVGRSD